MRVCRLLVESAFGNGAERVLDNRELGGSLTGLDFNRHDVEHVARSVVHMASLPLDTNVQYMTIMATKMPFVGRG